MLSIHDSDRGRRHGPLAAVLSILIAALTMFGCDRDEDVEPVAETPEGVGVEQELDEPSVTPPSGAQSEGYGEDPYAVDDPMVDDSMGESVDDSMPNEGMGEDIDDSMMGENRPIGESSFGEPSDDFDDSEFDDEFGLGDEPGSINEDELVENDPLVDDGESPPMGTPGATGDTGMIADGEDDSEVIGDESGFGNEPELAEDRPTIAEAQRTTGRTVSGSTMQPTTEMGLCGEGAVPPQFHPALELDVAHLDNKLQSDVTTTITSPSSGQLVENDTLELQLDVTGFDVDTNERLVQVLIDDEPVGELMRLSNGPLRIDLAGHDLEPGAHLVRVFPVRPWGELVSDGAAAGASLPFFYREETGELADLTKPMLTLASPVGRQQVNAGTNRVLFDVATSNVELGKDGHKVRMTLDGHAPVELTQTVPLLVSGLSSGEHTVKLELIDANGAVVDGPFTSVERTFDVRMTRQTAFVDEPVEPSIEQPSDDGTMNDADVEADEPMIDKPMNDGAAKVPR